MVVDLSHAVDVPGVSSPVRAFTAQLAFETQLFSGTLFQFLFFFFFFFLAAPLKMVFPKKGSFFSSFIEQLRKRSGLERGAGDGCYTIPTSL